MRSRSGSIGIVLVGLVFSGFLAVDGSALAQIVFVSDRHGRPARNEIFVMDSDGTSQTRLTTNSVDDRWPTWTPDGSKIAFSSGRDGNFEIYKMDPDGANQTCLTNETSYDCCPTWSKGAMP